MKLGTVLGLAVLLALPPAARAAENAGDGAAEAPSALEKAITDYEARTRLPETVVTVTRGPRAIFDLPRSVLRIDRETILEEAPRHLVQTMTNRDAGIIMDIRTGTTGDPVMRGFAGFNILTLVDGNTLSTLWGEGGFGADDMYGKIDPDTVARIEIVRGPNSVLYGSNALGGVINLITRSSPIDYTEEGFAFGGRLRTTYHSVNDGLRGRIEGWGATPELKFLVGYSRADYGNLKRGGDNKELTRTGGRESNVDARADWLFLPGNELTFTVQRVDRWNLGRHYRPTQDNRNERLGLGLTWTADDLFDFMQPFKWRVYYQKKRDERSFYDTGREGYAETITYSTDLTASTRLAPDHFLTYGLHAHVDDGESPDDEQFTISGFTTAPYTRADAPNSLWANYGIFVQDEWDAIADRLTVTASLRYDFFVFNSAETDEYQPAGGDREADFFRDETGALTGGLGLTYRASEEWRVLGSYSRGFRQFAPNFGFRQLGNGVLIPNELLDPVTSDNFEIGARCRYPAFHAEGFTYYSYIDRWQALRPDTYQGMDWYDFNENGVQDANESIISQQAEEHAWIAGFELRGTVFLPEIVEEIPDGWSVWSSVAWNYGKVSDGEYLRHTQPFRGLVGLRWDDRDPERAAYFELVTEMTAKYDRLPSDREQNDLAYRSDPQDGSSPMLRDYGGVPGYTIVNLYAGLNLCETARLNVGVENLFDKKYRRAHSRMDAPGMNLILSLDIVF